MNYRRHSIKVALFFAVIMFLASGCTGLKNYGTLDGATGKITIKDLIENWENYSIYYAGLAVDNPSAVMFDAKIEGRRITCDKWVPVTKKSVLVSIVKWLDANINYLPELWRIVGPNGRPFGYMYTYWESVELKAIDDKTLWVGDLPLPPFDYGPGVRG